MIWVFRGNFMKRFILLSVFLLFMVLLLSCKAKRYEDAKIIVRQMSLDEKIGQMIMVGVPGSQISVGSREILKKYHPGGIILFGFNFSKREKTIQFIDNLQKASMEYTGIPLFVATDQEGGRVRRITDGVTQFPGNMAFGIVDDEDIVNDSARIIGIQLRLIGVNMNLTPVLDVNNNPENPVINTRSFGSTSDIVSRLGVSYIKGLQGSRCISAAKHFPGHGDTNKDSHITLPVINYDMERLEEIELKPFVEAIDSGVEALMTAHIAYPKVLKNYRPVTVSRVFLNDILRNEYEFDGLIITDDMEMDAISKSMDLGEAAVRSIQAGADIVLISSYGEHIPIMVNSLKRALETGFLNEERIERSVVRIIEVKLRYGIMDFVEGRISLSRISFEDEELELLSRAENINRRVSRDALYYTGKDVSVFNEIGSGMVLPIFITTNRTLQGYVRLRIKNAKILNSLYGFMEYCRALRWKQSPESRRAIVVFYHVEKLEVGALEKLRDYTQRNSQRLIILSTGNPFELNRLESLPPTLFTFSNTEVSLNALVDCIRGAFIPRGEIAMNLGIKR
jgi:beta-N-acetylhexosaminidase